jgi:hypothetical protein
MDRPTVKAILHQSNHKLDPAKIAAPALLIVGEGEYKSEEVKRQHQV